MFHGEYEWRIHVENTQGFTIKKESKVFEGLHMIWIVYLSYNIDNNSRKQRMLKICRFKNINIM